MYAVIETGGKQHKIEKGMKLPVDLLKEEPGSKVTFDNVNEPAWAALLGDFTAGDKRTW